MCPHRDDVVSNKRSKQVALQGEENFFKVFGRDVTIAIFVPHTKRLPGMLFMKILDVKGVKTFLSS